MKMKALKLALLAAGLVSGSVSAAFTEGDLAADNSITLNGEITNTNPVWAWKTGADQLDWDTTRLEWKVTGANATVDFSGKGDVTLLDGYLVNLAPKGGVGLSPVVTIGGDGYTVTAGAGTMEQTAKVKVTGLTDATDSTSTVDGEMTFKMVMALSSGWEEPGKHLIRGITLEGGVHNYANPTTTTNAKYMAALNKAWDNQKLSADYATAPYSGATTVAPSTTVFSPGQVFSDAIASKITAGIHSNIHSAQVTFPSATIPESWEGALTVTVAYQ